MRTRLLAALRRAGPLPAGGCRPPPAAGVRHCQQLAPAETCEHLRHRLDGRLLRVQLWNPDRKNAMNLPMYRKMAELLRFADASEQVRCVLVTGSDGFYSSGNDLGFLKSQPADQLDRLSRLTIRHMDDYIGALIRLRKPLVGALNGPAIGIGASTLGLFDVLLASRRAYLWTPFSRIALVAEGCSSFTFPRLMGAGRAAQMILFNHRLSAEQANRWGFVQQLWEEAEFDGRLAALSERLAAGDLQPLGWLGVQKRIPRTAELVAEMDAVNEREGDLLRRAWFSAEYQEYLARFYAK